MTLLAQHLQEWTIGSGVDPEIVRLNVESIEDSHEIDRRLNRNTDRRWKHSDFGAGWWVNGVDPFRNEQTLIGGQFKPDTPWNTGQIKKDGTPKLMKYISASQQDVDPLFLDIPWHIWQRVADRFSLPLEESEKVGGFWVWAMKHPLSIALVEGAKKAGACFTQGIPAISIPGVNNGQKFGRLRPKLKPFTKTGKRILLGFDADWREKPAVYHALCDLGKQIAPEGADIHVLEWDDSRGKGIDDYLVNGGTIDEVLEGAIGFSHWKKVASPEKKEADLNMDTTGLDPKDEIQNRTFEDHVYRTLFENGKGDYIVLDSAFYQYDGYGAWSHLDDEEIKKKIAQYSRRAYKLKRNRIGEVVGVDYPFAKTSNVSSAFEFCRTLLAENSKIPYNRDLLCFRNCTINVSTGEILKHSKDHYLLTRINADYVAGAPLPNQFGRFIASAYGIEQIEVIQAVTSMLLDPTAPYGKFPHLIGPSGSGKGTLLSVWEGMFGLDNTRSAASLSELQTPEGRYQNLTGVGFFQCPDIGGYQQGLRAFYNLVDNVPMSARPLFSKRAIQKQFNVRFAVASVDHLKIENSGDGWDRRAIPLPTRQRLGEMDPYLKTKLLDERANIISWALSMSKERRDWVLNNLHTFEAIENARNEASIAGDPIRLFVEYCLRPPSEGSGETKVRMDSKRLHTYYTAFCAAFRYQPASLTTFVNHLKTVLPDHYVARKRMTTEEALLEGITREKGELPLVSAHWVNVEPLEGVFEQMSEDGDTCKCIKKNCEEGGGWAFAAFAHRRRLESDHQRSSTIINSQELVIGLEPLQNKGSEKPDHSDHQDHKGNDRNSKKTSNGYVPLSTGTYPQDEKHDLVNSAPSPCDLDDLETDAILEPALAASSSQIINSAGVDDRSDLNDKVNDRGDRRGVMSEEDRAYLLKHGFNPDECEIEED